VTLPSIAPEGRLAAAADFRVLHHPAASAMRLLVVEDDDELGGASVEYFEQHGIAVDWRRDGMSCLQALREDDFDAVLLDLGLPGATGMRVLHVARMDPTVSRVPFVVVTGADPGYSRRARGMGAVRVLHKPVRLHTVMRVLREVVAQRRLSA